MTIAFVFPGQGSQAVGMGAELAKASPAARLLFDEIDAALDQKLSDLMFNGPLDTLTLTENAQPALDALPTWRVTHSANIPRSRRWAHLLSPMPRAC
jgi:[acyl-carrier-protein] S-malonyltransferase